VPRYLSPHETAESHPPIVAALRRRDAQSAIRHMEHGVLAVGEQIAATLREQQQPGVKEMVG
jgi:DNA-binding GntR family transcriptional regulator